MKMPKPKLLDLDMSLSPPVWHHIVLFRAADTTIMLMVLVNH